MKLIEFDHLASLRQDEIDELITSKLEFVIVADGEKKSSLLSFLENEERYFNGKRRLLERIAYLWGARHAFSIIPFVTIWNKALMNGLEIKSKKEINSKIYLSFDKRGD
ncbi:hypothetical protein INH39_07545 [Massilia violaceinigra]|uniref:Uncharacterized protein n=1 Tax=Massilia violaceinigra TaxID=2045208 RepID=A0ABY4AAZ1_9BURK|nr:hypothetical protein [Massilia violaceinigra]UOD31537.1 hypothetical protein INH39_07545 [Massilia violaceinigra]